MGPAQLYPRLDTGESKIGSIIMIPSPETEQYAGLVLRQSLCEAPCYTNQNSGIVVCLSQKWEQPLKSKHFREDYDPSVAEAEGRNKPF